MFDRILAESMSGFIIFSAVNIIMMSLAAARGSLASIAAQWHEETIYSQCIRPFVREVTSLPCMVSWAFGLLLFLGLTTIGVPNFDSPHFNLSIHGIISVLPSYYIAYNLARVRGRRIYGRNIQRLEFTRRNEVQREQSPAEIDPGQQQRQTTQEHERPQDKETKSIRRPQQVIQEQEESHEEVENLTRQPQPNRHSLANKSSETKLIIAHSCGKRVQVAFHLLARGPICPSCKGPVSISKNLERIIAHLRMDLDFANLTVSRNGANLRLWIPRLTEEEMTNVLLVARFLVSEAERDHEAN